MSQLKRNSAKPTTSTPTVSDNQRAKGDIEAPDPWAASEVDGRAETGSASEPLAATPTGALISGASTRFNGVALVQDTSHQPGPATAVPLARPLVLVGLMGAGKTSVGRRLARELGTRFVDSDQAIEDAAGMTVADIFELYGEGEFRALERRVIRRLLEENEAGVVALGGGAFMAPETRELVLAKGHVIWLKAALDVLVERTARKPGKRPLLANGDPRAVLADLMARREPVYALAHDTVVSGEAPLAQVVASVAERARRFGAGA